MNRRVVVASVRQAAILLSGLLILAGSQLAVAMPESGDGAGQTPRDPSRPVPVCEPSSLDSPYIPVDSWVYPAVFRLYGMGYIDSVYLGMRPWTRASVDHMLEEAGARIEDAQDYSDAVSDEAQAIYEALDREINPDMQGPCRVFKGKTRVESVYSASRAISGTPLRDSFHFGQTIVNDYGRPYANGFNNYSGASGYASAGRFVLYARGEFQAAPSATGYSQAWRTNFLRQIRFPSSIPQPDFLTIKPPFRWGPSPMPPASAGLRPTSPRMCSTTKSPSASRTTGSGPASAQAWPTQTMPRISTPSASTGSSHFTFRGSPSSPARFATNSSSAGFMVTPIFPILLIRDQTNSM